MLFKDVLKTSGAEHSWKSGGGTIEGYTYPLVPSFLLLIARQ